MFNCQTKRAIVALFIYPEISPCRVFFLGSVIKYLFVQTIAQSHTFAAQSPFITAQFSFFFSCTLSEGLLRAFLQTKCDFETTSLQFVIWLVFVADLTLANCRVLFSHNSHQANYRPAKQSKKLYNKELINLECSALTGKSPTKTLRIDLALARSIWQGVHSRFSLKDLTLVQ